MTSAAIRTTFVQPGNTAYNHDSAWNQYRDDRLGEAIIHRMTLQQLRPGKCSVSRQRSDDEHGPLTTFVCAETARGTCGYGEIAPFPGEPDGTVPSPDLIIERTIGPYLLSFHPKSFPEALESIECLPLADDRGRSIHRVRAAVEHALLDLTMRVFRRDVDAIVRWMGLPGFGVPGSAKRAAPSIALPSVDAASTIRIVRRCLWRGYRHFKMPLGRDDDPARLRDLGDYLARPIARSRITLRVDAQGLWSKDQAVEWLSDHATASIAAIEQPLPRGREHDLPILKDLSGVPLFHGASVASVVDAQTLSELGVADGIQIELARCGGLMPALRVASFARREGIRLSLGFPRRAGELSSAAGVRFLQVCPGVEWFDFDVTGASSTEPITRKPIRLRRGGRALPYGTPGWGVDLDPRRMQRCTVGDRILLHF